MTDEQRDNLTDEQRQKFVEALILIEKKWRQQLEGADKETEQKIGVLRRFCQWMRAIVERRQSKGETNAQD